MEQENSSKIPFQPERKKQFWLWILMGCMTFIFILAIVIFVGGWWVFKDKVQDNLDLVEDETYFENEDWLQDFDEFIEDSKISSEIEPNIINGNKKFVSNEYGFTLDFTDNWLDYKAELIVDGMNDEEYFNNIDLLEDEKSIDQLRKGLKASYKFYYPTEQENLFNTNVDGYTDLFSLDILRLDDYDLITSGKVKEIARNNKYIFTYTNYYVPQQDTDIPPPQDIPQSALDDINIIVEAIETFNVRVLE